MSSSSSSSGLRAFVEAVRDSTAGPGACAVAGGAGALGAALASMALRALADEGGGQASYQAGRAEELGELATRLLELGEEDAELARKTPGATPERAAELHLARVEAGLEVGEAALAALRLSSLEAPGGTRSEPAVAAALLRAAVLAGAACAEARLPDLDDAAARELRRSTAALLRLQAEELGTA